jgi:D-glycero-D-manno-heptose 1,7-bisphosphate phosphatase
MVRRAVFLDRDGVINANVERDGRLVAPMTLDDFRLLPGAAESIRKLKEADFVTIVVTNQPDVATGRTPRTVVEAMHAKIRASMPLDDIKVCYHSDADRCGCRKPKPGLILNAAREHDIDVSLSYVVGDRWRDVEAGRQAGCKMTILVRQGSLQDDSVQADRIVGSVSEAVDFILGDRTT